MFRIDPDEVRMTCFLSFCIEIKEFNKEYNENIYSVLKMLFVDQRIDFYNINTEIYDPRLDKTIYVREVDEAKKQFTYLQKKWNGKRYKIEALTGYHDDICDAIAAASYEALNEKMFSRLPKTKAVYIPFRRR